MYSCIAILLFLALCTATTGLLSRIKVPIIIVAIVAAAISTITYQVINFLLLGYLDPFFLIALLYSFPLAFVICFVAGILIGKIKAKAKTPNAIVGVMLWIVAVVVVLCLLAASPLILDFLGY